MKLQYLGRNVERVNSTVLKNVIFVVWAQICSKNGEKRKRTYLGASISSSMFRRLTPDAHKFFQFQTL